MVEERSEDVYLVTEEIRYIEDTGPVKLYGICLNPGLESDGEGENGFLDLSRSRTFVRRIARILNERDVSPVHMKDVVEDILNDAEFIDRLMSDDYDFAEIE